MPPAITVELRIYCLCGQKMKVSAAMFGRPGRCVACSQKIRIPKPEELPAGLTDIYLKDFPEFLRKTPRLVDEPGQNAEPEDESLGEPPDQSGVVPLDTLESVQRLCSYEYLVSRALERYRGAQPGSPEAIEKAQIMGYRALARKARSELDDRFRRFMMDVAIELSDVKEKIARAGMSARVGEINFRAYIDAVSPLRRRRETLERLRYNLRAWLTVTDPYLAGGLLDTPLEDPPVDVANTGIPETAFREDQALLDQLLGHLREALEEREYAERKLSEWNRVQKDGGLTGFNIERYRNSAEASRERGKAMVAFCRERVQQALQDAENEVKAVRAHLELARHRLEANEITPAQFNEIELELLRAQADSAKACDLARLTLRAQSIEEIPRIQTKLLQRLVRRDRNSGIGLDSWLAWAAALMMVLAVFVPIVDPIVGGNAVALRWLIIGMVMLAAALAITASLPSRRMRGLILGLLWLVGGVGFTLYLHGKYHGLERVGDIMRRDPNWLVQPGMLILMGSGLLAAFAYFTALLQEKGLRHIPFVIAAAGVLIGGAVATDLAGLLKPVPVVVGIEKSPVVDAAGVAKPAYRVEVVLSNLGRRPYWLNARESSNPAPAVFRFGRRLSGSDWNYDARPVRLSNDGATWREIQAVPADLVVRPGQNLHFEYLLPPGEYRAEVLPSWRQEGDSRVFELAPPPEPEPEPQPAETQPGPATEPPPEEMTDTQQAAATEDPAIAPETEGSTEPAPAEDPSFLPTGGPELELRGVGSDPSSGPRFALSLHYPDGRVTDIRVGLGDRIYRTWTALEYDPTRTTLTVGTRDEDGNVGGLRIIRTGERIPLPTAE